MKHTPYETAVRCDDDTLVILVTDKLADNSMDGDQRQELYEGYYFNGRNFDKILLVETNGDPFYIGEVENHDELVHDSLLLDSIPVWVAEHLQQEIPYAAMMVELQELPISELLRPDWINLEELDEWQERVYAALNELREDELDELDWGYYYPVGSVGNITGITEDGGCESCWFGDCQFDDEPCTNCGWKP